MGYCVKEYFEFGGYDLHFFKKEENAIEKFKKLIIEYCEYNGIKEDMAEDYENGFEGFLENCLKEGYWEDVARIIEIEWEDE